MVFGQFLPALKSLIIGCACIFSDCADLKVHAIVHAYQFAAVNGPLDLEALNKTIDRGQLLSPCAHQRRLLFWQPSIGGVLLKNSVRVAH